VRFGVRLRDHMDSVRDFCVASVRRRAVAFCGGRGCAPTRRPRPRCRLRCGKCVCENITRTACTVISRVLRRLSFAPNEYAARDVRVRWRPLPSPVVASDRRRRRRRSPPPARRRLALGCRAAASCAALCIPPPRATHFACALSEFSSLTSFSSFTLESLPSFPCALRRRTKSTFAPAASLSSALRTVRCSANSR